MSEKKFVRIVFQKQGQNIFDSHLWVAKLVNAHPKFNTTGPGIRLGMSIITAFKHAIENPEPAGMHLHARLDVSEWRELHDAAENPGPVGYPTPWHVSGEPVPLPIADTLAFVDSIRDATDEPPAKPPEKAESEAA